MAFRALLRDLSLHFTLLVQSNIILRDNHSVADSCMGCVVDGWMCCDLQDGYNHR